MTNGAAAWLPALVPLASCGGDFQQYLQVLFGHFTQDFVATQPTYPNRRWALKRYPEYDGKPATFWHLISEGEDEENRLPDLRRSERIRWPRPMIDAVLNNNVTCWRNQRGRSTRVIISLTDYTYVVILEDRGAYILLWTAYPVEHSNQRRQLAQEYARYGSKRSLEWLRPPPLLRDGLVAPSTRGG